MAIKIDRVLRRQLNTLFNTGVMRELTDGQLLERFATGGGEAAELAFAALVERHGAMVLRVCRARLADPHDTEDAFQATFLILVKKARALWVRDSLGPWLHQVAFRTASCARSTRARRKRLERQVAEAAVSVEWSESRTGSELEEAIHEEINRLPECYRVPIVLCDLQGHTCEEAARRIGRPVGTVKSWRSRGRERLRDRLTRLGLAPAAGLGAAFATGTAQGALSARKSEETVRLATRALTGGVTAGEVSASVRTLVEGVIKTMFLGKMWTAATAVFALVFVAAAVGIVARVGAGDSKDGGGRALAESPRTVSLPPDEPRGVWALSLSEAIRMGLGNSKEFPEFKLLASEVAEDRLVVAPARTDVEATRFKATVMAAVRSFEQAYWDLVQQHAQLRAIGKAVKLAEEILRREQSALEVGRGDAANIAEIQQRLEQLRLDLVTKTSDSITTERQLRAMLGLPTADDRRIVPVTLPTEAKREPIWEECLAAMLEKQPDIVEARAKLKKAEAAQDSLAQLERAKKALDQIIHQTTHALARFFLEEDANYEQFQTAARSRAAAAQRLEAERASYEEGRITIDHYLAAVSQHALGAAQEAQYKSSYNISIIGLEEAKGTLLDYHQITLVGGLKSANFTVAAARPAPAHQERLVQPGAPPQPVALRMNDGEAKEASPKADPAGKTFSFQFTVGVGSSPIDIRGSFTITPAGSVDAPKAP